MRESSLNSNESAVKMVILTNFFVTIGVEPKTAAPQASTLPLYHHHCPQKLISLKFDRFPRTQCSERSYWMTMVRMELICPLKLEIIEWET